SSEFQGGAAAGVVRRCDGEAAGVDDAQDRCRYFGTDAVTRNQRHSMCHAWSFVRRNRFVKLSSKRRSLNPTSAVHFRVPQSEQLLDTAYTVRYKAHRLVVHINFRILE